MRLRLLSGMVRTSALHQARLVARGLRICFRPLDARYVWTYGGFRVACCATGSSRLQQPQYAVERARVVDVLQRRENPA